MADDDVFETMLVDVPVSVADALVNEAAGSYVARTRDAGTTVATAIAVLGVASDVISLTMARQAITDLVRRCALWGYARADQSELTLRIGDRIDLRLRVTGPESDGDLVAVTDRILKLLDLPD
jgi:hypothetical protein